MSALALRGRTVALTGAAGGIGAALTAEFVAAGARVLAIGRDAARLRRLADAHPPGVVVALAADVSESEGRAAIVARARDENVSVLVLAHAQAAFGQFESQSDEMLERMLRTNLTAPILLIRALLPTLRAHASAQAPAAVVAVGSTFGALAFPGFVGYSASKYGLRGLIEGLHREYADEAIRFQYLAPRATRTDFNSAAVVAMNRELKTAEDAPETVAAALRAAIERGTPRLQLGWPEALFVRLNALLPSAIDRDLKKRLPIVRRHAVAASSISSSSVSSSSVEVPHDPVRS